MKSLAFATTTVLIVFLFQQNLQVVDSLTDNTYPYRHISKQTTDEYTCRYPRCTEYMARLKEFRAGALSKWDSMAPYLQTYTEMVTQFDRLDTISRHARQYNLTQCIQDFADVFTLQRLVYNNVFNICVVEATKQNTIDYVTKMTALKNIMMYLDADTHQQVLHCGSDSNCTNNAESPALEQMKLEESRGIHLADWYEKRLLFDNVNSVRECVRRKTSEQVEDIKKIVNTIENCLSYLFNTIR